MRVVKDVTVDPGRQMSQLIPPSPYLPIAPDYTVAVNDITPEHTDAPRLSETLRLIAPHLSTYPMEGLSWGMSTSYCLIQDARYVTVMYKAIQQLVGVDFDDSKAMQGTMTIFELAGISR